MTRKEDQTEDAFQADVLHFAQKLAAKVNKQGLSQQFAVPIATIATTEDPLAGAATVLTEHYQKEHLDLGAAAQKKYRKEGVCDLGKHGSISFAKVTEEANNLFSDTAAVVGLILIRPDDKPGGSVDDMAPKVANSTMLQHFFKHKGDMYLLGSHSPVRKGSNAIVDITYAFVLDDTIKTIKLKSSRLP